TISLNGDLSAGNLVPDPPFTLKGTGRLGFNAGEHLIVQTNIYSAIMMDLTVTGPGNMTKTGTNVLFLVHSNNFSGTFTILDGPVVISNAWSLGATSGSTVVGPGGSLVMGAWFTFLTVSNEPLVLQPGGSLTRRGNFSTTFAGPVSLPGPGSSAVFTNPSIFATYVNLAREITGPGGVTIAGNIGYTGTGNNTYAGPTLVQRGELVLNKPGFQAIAGTLVIGDDNPLDDEEYVTSLASEQIANSAEVIIHNGSRWNLGDQVETIARLSGGTVTNGGIMQLPTLASALIVGAGDSDFHFAGQFAGEGYLEKIGAGTGILSGNSSGYTGQTSINEGALDVRGYLAGSEVSIIPGARLTGSGAIGDLFAQNGGIYEPGRTGFDGLNILTSSNLNLAPGAVLRIPIWGSTTGQHGKASVKGIVNLTNAVLDIVMMTPPVVGVSYRIIENDGVDLVNGTFAGLPGGDFTGPGGLLWSIEYDNDVTITLLSQGQAILPPSLEGEDFLDLVIGGGNGDGYADPNECIDLFIPLHNDSMQTNPVIAAMLSSPHPELIVLQSFSEYPETGPGEANYNLTPFKVSVPTNFLCGTNLPLVLTVKNGTNALYALPVGLPTGKPADTPVRFDSDGPFAIPDEDTLIDLVFVQNFTGHLAKVEVSLHISHPNLETLNVTLVGPGENIMMPLALSQPGTSYGSGCADPSRTEFAADAATFIGAAAAPYVGTFRPVGILPLVRGMADDEVNNRWYLWVEDTVAGDVGTLECWSLFLYPAECGDGGGICPRCPEPIEDTIETDGPMAFARLIDLDPESPPTSCFEGPGTYIEAPGSFHYQSYSYYNLSTNDVCAVVTLETGCLGVDSIISMAYLGNIDPFNVSANLLGFIGQPPTSNTPQRTYSFIAPPESHVTVVVMAMNSNEGCKGFTLQVDHEFLCTPELFIGPLEADKVRLHWSTNHVGYLLHKNTSMLAPTNWVFVPDTPALLGNRFVVTNQPIDPEAFYRLMKP
ncbi:MAG TPA: autotransporter-associated beta strand repeat-containing protein, partial [Kiritimatiellia bacterium]|nr:autotransporter-associated beta strand repeat-containing protein [Kiritimatiellia bacterium]